MPQFDLRNMKCAAYTNNNGSVSYGTINSMGDAMTANLELRFAEARLYAESTLAEYLRKAIGGTISVGVKYIPTATQKVLFGSSDKTRSVGTGTGSSITGLNMTAKDVQGTVGVAFYAPDMVDGEEKYTCVFIPRCRFGQPSMSLQTLGETIQFNTPTINGEFLADHTSSQNMLEVAVVDTAAKAAAWCTVVLGGTAS